MNTQKARQIENEIGELPSDKKVLVLDLDETLFYALPEQRLANTIPVEFKVDGDKMKWFVSKRPGLEFFMQEMAKFYTIIVYTASIREYAEAILRKLQLEKFITLVLHRDQCFQGEDHKPLKDISIIGVAPSNVLLIDDSERHIVNQPQNSLKIKAFQGNNNDLELFHLAPFLIDLSQKNDVRSVSTRYNKYMDLLVDKLPTNMAELRTQDLGMYLDALIAQETSGDEEEEDSCGESTGDDEDDFNLSDEEEADGTVQEVLVMRCGQSGLFDILKMRQPIRSRNRRTTTRKMSRKIVNSVITQTMTELAKWNDTIPAN